MTIFRSNLFALIALAVSASTAHAHNLLLDRKIVGERLQIEAFYDDDTPAQQANVQLRNGGGQVIAEGKTDERGLWSCPLPGPGTYTIKAQNLGHAKQMTITIAETGPQSSNDSSSTSSMRIALDAIAASSASEPTREDRTRTPWRNVVGGCGLIAVVFAMIWLYRRNSPLAPR